jgi:acetaldehyde dehydrogenase/alcohol dehydrogenase
MAICDANLVDNMPKSLTAFGGLDALVHALESYVSVCATDYTKGEQQRAVGRAGRGVLAPGSGL